MSGDEWLSISEAAEVLGLTRLTVGRFVQTGEIPARRSDRRVHIRRSDLDEYIVGQQIEPGYLAHLNRAAQRDP